MKSLLLRLLGVLIIVALLILVGIGGYFTFRHLTRPTMAGKGGTILVYEFDADAFPDGKVPPGLQDDLAAALKRRVDPSDDAGITVQSVGDHRVEISIPRSARHEEHVAEVKELLMTVGTLEFRMVANDGDDAEGIAAARKILENAHTDAGLKKELEARARAHRPPPGPEGKFPVKLFDGTYEHSYSWVELGRLERKMLGLSNDQRDRPIWQEVAAARDRGEAALIAMGPDDARRSLFFSRKVELELAPPPGRPPSNVDRDLALKEFEYFILMRDPEPGAEVSGKYLNAVHAIDTARGRPAVAFRFSNDGAKLFTTLTSRNRPQEGRRRQLGIILDGMLESAPTLNAVISAGEGVIEGDFTKEEVDRYVRILRAGALPTPLKPLPVAERSVEPAK